MRFIPQAAPVALSNPGEWESLEQQPDGAVEVTFSAPDLDWAASMVLAYGPIVQAMEPAGLRERVCGWAQAILDTYSLKE